jgi:hypothetical protein
MSLVTLNGIRVRSAEVRMPHVGRWEADVAIDAAAAPTGRVVLKTAGMELRGTVERGGTFAERSRVRVVPGAGGLTTPLTPKFYTSVTVRTVLADLMLASGETLSGTSDSATLDRVLTSWSRPAGDAITALNSLASQTGSQWRTLDDGSVWVGVHTWPTVTFAHSLLGQDMAAGSVTIASETPRLRPGVTFLGQQLHEVVHTFESDAVRTRASFGGSLGSLLSQAVTRLGPDVDALRTYAGTVVGQAPDGTLEIKADDTTHAPIGWTKVPIRSGLPGTRVTVASGQRVRVQYENGDRTRPMAALWDEGTAVESISVAGGSLSVARATDTVDCGMLIVTTTAAGAVSLIGYVDGTTATAVREAALAAATAAAASSSSVVTSINLVGAINPNGVKLKA